jgi:hypothetical protein
MDSNLSIDTLSFKLAYSDKTGSLRTEVSRGVNLPETLQIRHTPYAATPTQSAGVNSQVRFERVVESAVEGSLSSVVATLTVRVPSDAGIESTDVTNVIQRLVTLLQEDDSGLDLADEIFVNKEQ